MKRFVSGDALLLEDFDIKNMDNWFPQKKIGVNVIQIYIQIAKLSGNYKRKEELLILSKTISSFGVREYTDEPRYVVMQVRDAKKCFGKCLKKLPKRTFVEIREM